MKKTVLCTAVVMAMGVSTANAVTFDFVGQFTFTDASGVVNPPDTNVTGTFTLPSATNPFGSGAFTSTEPFNGKIWTADVDRMFFYDTSGPASQSITWNWDSQVWNGTFLQPQIRCKIGDQLDGCAAFDATNPPAPGYTLAGTAPNAGGYTITMTASNQFVAGVFFDWSTSIDIGVIAALQIDNQTPQGVLTVSSWDGDGDGRDGVKMNNGPFPDQTAAFGGTLTPQVAPIPVPAAVWLFGSGLVGLVGVARRRR